MGTEFRIVLYAGESERAQAAAEAAFARVVALERALSDYDEHSELTRLGTRSDAVVPTDWIPVSRELGSVLAEAQALARHSGGAFDVTVGPYTRLWRRARRQGELPRAERLEQARAAVGFQQLELALDARAARLHARGMRLDLGGIGKGFALDEAFEVLRAKGFTRLLVVGGGELRAGAPPPGQRGWRVRLVGLESPAQELELAHAALATSGDESQALALDERRHSHILDPRTGEALAERRLVSILGPRATLTDGLATAVSVLGTEAGLRFLGQYPEYGARIQVLRSGRIEERRSASFPTPLSCEALLPPGAETTSSLCP